MRSTLLLVYIPKITLSDASEIASTLYFIRKVHVCCPKGRFTFINRYVYAFPNPSPIPMINPL